jgi:hypothetical protein
MSRKPWPILLATVALATLPLLSARAAAKHTAHHAAPDTGPVILTQQPGTALDVAARQLTADDLAGAKARGETPIVLIGSAPLSAHAGDTALFVQVQSASLCGSAGCSTSVYLRHDRQWTKVLDSVSGPVTVLAQTHGGMRDLRIDSNDRWVWRNGAYHDTMPALPIGDLRKSIEEHQAAVRAHGGTAPHEP